MRPADQADGPARRADAARAAEPSPAERLLLALGAEPSLLEAVLGDLAEERAARASRDGALSAWLWLAGESARSAPHLAAATVRHLARHDPRRLALLLGAAALASLGAVAALQLRARPAARIAGSDGPFVILNGSRAVRLPVSVRDARGRPLDSAAVRFAWLSGVPLRMNDRGDVTCARAGDARVRATVDRVATDLVVRCRPVNLLHAADVDMAVGDVPAALDLEALDSTGRRVDLLAGRLTFDDSSVATFDRGLVRPRAAGHTLLEISIGDERARVGVFVHSPAPSLDSVVRRPEGVTVPVHLGAGETRRWPLPRGTFMLWVRESDDARPLRLAVLDSRCGPGTRPLQLVCNSRGESTVVVYRPPGAGGDGIIDAELLARRVPDWALLAPPPDSDTAAAPAPHRSSGRGVRRGR